jgi:hypothetical protein
MFAWKPLDMPGVSRDWIEHSLNVDPKAKTHQVEAVAVQEGQKGGY